MSEHDSQVAHMTHVASVHAAITALSTSMGELKGRLEGIEKALNHHMLEEHRDFRGALALLSEVKAKLDSLHNVVDSVPGLSERVNSMESLVDQGKGAKAITGWYIAAITALAGVFAWFLKMVNKT